MKARRRIEPRCWASAVNGRNAKMSLWENPITGSATIPQSKGRFGVSRPLNTAAVIIALSLGPIPALATNYYDYHPSTLPQAQARPGYAGPVSLRHYYAAHPKSGR